MLSEEHIFIGNLVRDIYPGSRRINQLARIDMIDGDIVRVIYLLDNYSNWIANNSEYHIAMEP